MDPRHRKLHYIFTAAQWVFVVSALLAMGWCLYNPTAPDERRALESERAVREARISKSLSEDYACRMAAEEHIRQLVISRAIELSQVQRELDAAGEVCTRNTLRRNFSD